ncbi:MAG: S26 family signal peptidase [Gemmatimonadaceae bacterium]
MRTWQRGVLATASVGGALALAVVLPGQRMTFNLSASMPVGVYRLGPAPSTGAKRGQLVAACLPAAVARVARDRGYVTVGACPGGVAPVGKFVAATGGDTVLVTREGMIVNGWPVGNSRPLAIDTKGRPLQAMPPGSYHVAHGELWLVSSYSAHSFDSRYFGPVARAAVYGLLYPIWTSGSPP